MTTRPTSISHNIAILTRRRDVTATLDQYVQLSVCEDAVLPTLLVALPQWVSVLPDGVGKTAWPVLSRSAHLLLAFINVFVYNVEINTE